MKTTLTIALLQLVPGNSAAENLAIGLAACRRAKERGADLTLFPEALPADGEFVAAFGRLAAELEMAIGVTLLEAWPGAPRNTLVLFDRRGERKLTYAKVHTCDFDVERNLTPGDGFFVTELDTAAGPVQVGAMICFDREFPESARILMLQGAELILTPNACPMERNRLGQLRGRAYENMLAIATCNYPAGVPDCNGGSTLYDGVAYLPNQPGSRDMCVLQAGSEPGIYIAKLDLAQLRRYRETEAHGNAFRRPKLYTALTDTAIRPPFVREEYRGLREALDKRNAPAAGWLRGRLFVSE